MFFLINRCPARYIFIISRNIPTTITPTPPTTTSQSIAPKRLPTHTDEWDAMAGCKFHRTYLFVFMCVGIHFTGRFFFNMNCSTSIV